MQADISFLILEADEKVGGRIKSDHVDGFILDHGFKSCKQLILKPAASWIMMPRFETLSPGVAVMTNGQLFTFLIPCEDPGTCGLH